MNGTALIVRQRELLNALAEAAAARTRAEVESSQTLQADAAAVQADYERQVAASQARWQAALARADEELAAKRRHVSNQVRAERQALDKQYRAASTAIIGELDRDESQARQAIHESRWLTRTVCDARRKRLKGRTLEAQKQLRARLDATAALGREAAQWLARFHSSATAADQAPPDTPRDAQAAQEQFAAAERAVAEGVAAIRRLRLPYFLEHAGVAWIYLLAALAAAPVVGWLAAWEPLAWGAATAAVALGGGLAVYFWLRRVAGRRLELVAVPLLRCAAEAGLWFQAARGQLQLDYQAQVKALKAQRDAEHQAAVEKNEAILARCRHRRDHELPELLAGTQRRLGELEDRLNEELRRLAQLRDLDAAAARSAHDSELGSADEARRQRLSSAEGLRDETRAAAQLVWRQRLAALAAEAARLNAEVERACPSWEAMASAWWEPARLAPGAIRFGQLALVPGICKGAAATIALEAAEALPPALPALLPFPQGVSLAVWARGDSRRQATELIRVLMLRLLTALPPGSVRLTIVDPAGLGRELASFMHLVDHDPQLVGQRIWTEPGQIEERLSELTQHMENVIQMYLRDEFATLEAYNAQAGPLAEPYRILVVANYPSGLSEAAAARLARIVVHGPRCGVFTLLSVDASAALRGPWSLEPLKAHLAALRIEGGRPVWDDARWRELPLELDRLPPAETQKAILGNVGRAMVAARRVEVPFATIAPPPEAYWTASTRQGIDVPIGQAGANRLQHLRLGQGTAQHVLIAGKTGSGKSTLLHALVVNAALHYSPDELELYLIDFKKGVEFKAYATGKLPHARVVAIESEREFGLSVMQRLDREMHQRGDRFRAQGVHDLAGYRGAGGTLPRILLIVDEFQEFFVEDDKLAQEAALLLDRLVRQGRAFGIHVHLGSQTLAGAYSLARSTLGQMAVRIALECSEADAHLALSEDNLAARLLSRPGEAIYNDGGGLVEANHPFQVVWLPDDVRQQYLGQIEQLARQRLVEVPPPIVFEGSQPAELAHCQPVQALAALEAWPTDGHPARLWLGEPLMIQSSTSAALTRRSGAHLLWLGRNDEAVAGMFTAALVSLACQLPPARGGTDPSAARYYLLHGGARDGIWRPLIRLAEALPQGVHIAEAAQTADVLAAIWNELRRRQAVDACDGSVFLLLPDLARLPRLRRQDDDFSFARRASQDAPPPDRMLAEILSEGPLHGVHVLAWCDTLATLHRTLERQALKEFGTRVLLQMSGADSSLLVDTPAASRLGRHRALLFREDEESLERFRPFAPPAETWLLDLAGRLARRPAPASIDLPAAPSALAGAAEPQTAPPAGGQREA